MTTEEVRLAGTLLEQRRVLKGADAASLTNWHGALKITGRTCGSLGVNKEIEVEVSRTIADTIIQMELSRVEYELEQLGVDL